LNAGSVVFDGDGGVFHSGRFSLVDEG